MEPTVPKSNPVSTSAACTADDRRCPCARLAALAVAALLLAMASYRTLAVYPSLFVEDDAWYYMQIGYHLGTQGWSTFDGIHTTSGYHLGWAGLLAAVSAFASLISPTKEFFLLAAIAVYFLLGLIAADRFGRTAMEKAALGVFIFYPGLLMESQLLALVLLIVFAGVLAEKNSWLVWAAMAMVPLVRIDATVMLVPLVFYHLVRRDFGTCTEYCVKQRGTAILAVFPHGLEARATKFRAACDFAAFAKACLAAGLGVVLHFALMWAAFGRLASVSSLMKAGGSTNLAEIFTTNIARYGRSELAVFTVMLALALAAAWTARRRGQGLAVLAVVAGPAAFVLVHLAVNPIMRSWYFSPALFVFALVLLRTEAKAIRIAFLLLVCALALRETRNTYFFIRDDALTQRAEKNALFLADVRRLVPEREPIFQVDGCGYTGFFSGRPIVNGDGLMNTYAYLQRRHAGKLAGYLRENDIRYAITNSPLDGPDILRVGGLVLTRQDVEKLAASGNREVFQAFVLWRIRDSYFTDTAGATP